MKFRISILSVLITIGLYHTGFSQRPNDRFEMLNMEDGRQLPYLIQLPESYKPGKTYPVLIGPGAGTKEEKGSLFCGPDVAHFDWIIVSSMAFLGPQPVKTTQKLLETIRSNYRVEGNKFHLHGFSANSAGSFRVALALPTYFHSVTGIPGHPRTTDRSALSKLKGVTINFIVGEKDRYWLKASRAAEQQLRSLGIQTRFEVIPAGGHVLEALFGAGFMNRLEKLR